MSLLAAACSGGNGEASSTTAAVTSSPNPTTTATTAAPITVAPTTAAPTTTTTLVPIDGLVPDVSELAMVAVEEAPPFPIAQMCPTFDQFSAASPADTVLRTFQADPVFGPFTTLGFLEFAAGEADAFLDAYIEGASGPCAEFSWVDEAGTPFDTGWAVATGPTYGDRSLTLQVRGDTNGFPVNSDVVFIRKGDRVGYVGYLVTGGVPDELTRDHLTSAVASILDGEIVASVDLSAISADIAPLLPSLEDVAARGARRVTAAFTQSDIFNLSSQVGLPDAQCLPNLSTIGSLEVVQGAARRYFVDVDENGISSGEELVLAILEMPDGGADTFIDRWVAGANGVCAEFTDLAGHIQRYSIGSGPEFLDRTVTLFRRARIVVPFEGRMIEIDSVTDYVFIRSGDFVGVMFYTVFAADAPPVGIRNGMAQIIVEALLELNS